MGHKDEKKQRENCLPWANNSLRTSIIVVIAVTVLWQNTVPLAAAKIVHPVKGSLKLLKTSSLSLLHQSSSLSKSHHHRYKRDTSEGFQGSVDEEAYYDENFDVIPVMSGDSPKTVGEHLSQKAKEIAESLSQMWQSVADTFKHCVDAIRQIFSSDGEVIELTPEQEEQIRAAMEARAKAIEEQNEIYRNTYENQI